MRARDYCILHLKQRHWHFDRCSVQDCPQAPRYLFWAHQPRPTGPVWIHHHGLCPAHATEWCTAHQVPLKAIPTISTTDWDKVHPGGDYDQFPWFRLAAPGANSESTPAPAEAPTRLRDQVGLQQAVFQTVQQLEPCTNAQVKEALGEQRAVTHQALQALVKHGKVVKAGETYRVVPAVLTACK
jgi:hypothetical protein